MSTAMNHQHAVETLALERYLLGEMADEERDAFESHFFSCAECAEDARAGGAMRDGAAAGLAAATKRPSSRVLAMPAPRRRLASIVPWAAAASLALVAGYQALILQPALKQRAGSSTSLVGPIVLSPATLRPATRGDEPIVFASAGLVTLAVDLGGGAFGGEVEYEIRPAGGAAIVTDRARVPNDGAPLLLLVPAALLPPGGHYVLALKDPRNAGLTIADYRFTVGAR
jgi:anti-sigma factor RsiW